MKLFERGLLGEGFEESYKIDEFLNQIEMIYDRLNSYEKDIDLVFYNDKEMPDDCKKAVEQLVTEIVSRFRFLIYTNVYKLIKYINCLKDVYNTKSMLCWVTIGRNTIEQLAVLNYYTFELKFLSKERKNITFKELSCVENTLIKYSNGSRFNWEKLLKGDLDNLKDKYSPDDENIVSINVLTALGSLKKKMKSFENIETEYALFSEIVHPNRGSNLVFQNVFNSYENFELSLNADEERNQFIILLTLETITKCIGCSFSFIIQLEKMFLNLSKIKCIENIN